ncbi:hypothetical protein [Tsukamurella soli]|uniref:hypothetical protein n=1 Tax=Tsukamurella soli TaxID=644556 RepID=UPI00360974E1
MTTRIAALFGWSFGTWLLLTWTVTVEQLTFGGCWRSWSRVLRRRWDRWRGPGACSIRGVSRRSCGW